ncbi:uncharacterized protein LOC111263640 isoform X3 [Varroa jacobsoni]|uniref:uncharacterized protein LOC111263640 isoform X3 n=1 Tax=Varroa jacobsoni TaxID=62625 RepID=UPI000BF50D92|nr:uncharacterized protein LOC111263640 isoform X3 [Varroa jacobsoni]
MANVDALANASERRKNDNDLKVDKNQTTSNDIAATYINPCTPNDKVGREHNGEAKKIRRSISFSDTPTKISPKKHHDGTVTENTARQIDFADSGQDVSNESNSAETLRHLSRDEDSTRHGTCCFLARRQTIADLYPAIKVSSPNGTERRTSSESSLESLSYEKRNIREQFSCKYIPKDTGLLTPTASTETLVGRLCEASCVTPTLTPRSTQKTSSSVNGSNRKRQISIIPRIIATSPAVPVAKGPELVVIFRKMGTDLPKRLAKNERALSARKNSLGEFGVLKPTVQESFDAGFIQAYKLIAQCIDQASLMHRSIDDDQHEKHLTASSINEVLKSDHTGEFIQQILENVLTPLKEILDDPEADGVELALDTVEAAMSEASRGTYVEARDEPNDPLFERRARPSLWELERQFRRGAKDAYNQIIVEAFNDEAELDLKELVDNICELVSIYQMGVKRLLESNVTCQIKL